MRMFFPHLDDSSIKGLESHLQTRLVAQKDFSFLFFHRYELLLAQKESSLEEARFSPPLMRAIQEMSNPLFAVPSFTSALNTFFNCGDFIPKAF